MHEAFDPEPYRTLPDGEPRTPMWLPALGLGLLVVGGIVWLSAPGDVAADAKVAGASSASPSGAPATTAAPRVGGVAPGARP